MPAGPLLIGLTGPAGSGKDTVGLHLEAEHGFHRHAFAEPIRDMLTALLTAAGIDYAHLFERDLKEQPVPGLGISGRRLMQTLGTEWGRSLDDDLWVKHAALSLGLPLHGYDWALAQPVHGRIVITDVRFSNEAAWIERLGGRIVRVCRSVPSIEAHASEQQFERIAPWARLDNTRSREWLHTQADAMVGHLINGQQPGYPAP